jgi:hypothetical protein
MEIDSKQRHSREILSLFDRPTEYGTFMSSCSTRLSAAVSEFLRVLWFSRFRTEVVLGARGRGTPEVTSPFDSSTALLF